MLKRAIIFAIAAIIAGGLGFGVLADTAGLFLRLLFFLCLIICEIMFIMAFAEARQP